MYYTMRDREWCSQHLTSVNSSKITPTKRKRQNKSPEQRDSRLAKQRAQKDSKGCPNYDKLLQKREINRGTARKLANSTTICCNKRKNESVEQQKESLSKIRQAVAEKRKNETTEKRLAKLRQCVAKLRANKCLIDTNQRQPQASRQQVNYELINNL